MTTPAAGSPAVEEPSDSPDPKSFMHDILASNRWILGLTIASILATAAVLYFVVRQWPMATAHLAPAVADSAAAPRRPSGDTTRAGAPSEARAQGNVVLVRRYPNERDVLLMIILMGALGGLVHLTSSLAKYVGNRQLKRSWIIYYLLMPVEGAALAPMIYLLLRAGVLTTPAGAGEPSTASLNVVVLYGFAGLTGLFSKQAIEMLAEVFATVFKRVKAKDSIEHGEKPGTGGQ